MDVESRAYVQVYEKGFQIGERMNWQPIETAPMDGTVIDLWDGHYKHRVVNARWAHHYWIDGATTLDKSWGRDDRDGPFCGKPTHWMPLPKSPEEK